MDPDLYFSSPKMKMMKLLTISAILLAAAAHGMAQAADTRVPRISAAKCRVEVPAGVRVDCFDLTVAETRSMKNGRTISLPIAIVRSTAAEPRPDPVLYTAGGPGVGSMGMLRGAANLVPYTQFRDFIIFEQRGTQYASPSLQCPEVTEALHTNRELNRDVKAAEDAEIAAAAACRKRLVESGVDLGAYNSKESAADIEDLRKLLGVKKLNLYGISYSTRLMQNYVRAYPSAVRSVILDSVLPTTANWDETGVANIIGSLRRLIAACSADKECSAKYPNIEADLYLAAERLDREPVTVEASVAGRTIPVKLVGRDFVDLIYNMLENTRALGQIPWTIEQVNKGNYAPLKSYAEDLLTSSGFIWGMRYSVWCSEEMPFQDKRKIGASIVRDPRLRGFSVQGAMPRICRVWDVPAAAPVENKPVRIPVPVLAFGGEFDPDTPPEWGRKVASWSKHGYFFEVKSNSHQAMGRKCTFADIPAAFLEDPEKRPDASCLEAIKPLVFK